MSINIRALVNDAFRIIGMTSSNESVDGNDANIAIDNLNQILSEMNGDQLFPFMMKIIDFNVSANVNSLTIGESGADITAERPDFINSICYSTASNSNPYKVMQAELTDLLSNRIVSGAGAPFAFAYNASMPNGTIYFDRFLQSGSVITIMYTESIDEVTIDSVLTIPTNFTSVIKYALCRELCIRYQLPSDTVTRVDTKFKEAYGRLSSLHGLTQIPLSLFNSNGGSSAFSIQSGEN